MSSTESSTPSADLQRELEAELLDRRRQWANRLDKISGDRRREGAPLDQDFAEQATQRENDETLDALDIRGRQELDAIAAALDRMRSGSYGSCVRCGEAIPEARLRAQPEAIDCIGCREQAVAAS